MLVLELWLSMVHIPCNGAGKEHLGNQLISIGILVIKAYNTTHEVVRTCLEYGLMNWC